MSPFSDSELPPDTVVRAQAGDPVAREAIFRTFERPVRTLALRLVPRRAAADDLAQDVFVDVLSNLARFDGRGSFAGWVRAITVNRCLMHLRSPWQRSLRWLDALGEGDLAQPATPATSDGERLDLERALAQLGDTARVVVWLHDVEGYTHAEIGALLGGTPSFSKSQLARAHTRLRELLEPDGVEAPCMPVSTSC
ncbi:MAG: sigma-70 family RNA polymerase sigma factor [Gammaproteobacteria bacterium]|nr:sigma-70 family RNA polymerase sigma factor [Gammaproteobacteria bacterium]